PRPSKLGQLVLPISRVFPLTEQITMISRSTANRVFTANPVPEATVIEVAVEEIGNDVVVTRFLATMRSLSVATAEGKRPDWAQPNAARIKKRRDFRMVGLTLGVWIGIRRFTRLRQRPIYWKLRPIR